jgi:hypothetical protein
MPKNSERTIWFEKSHDPDAPYMYVNGPIVDAHMHPRIYDRSKAGLDSYTQTAIKSGITAGAFMLNESMRRADSESSDGTKTIPFPINNAERLDVTATIVDQYSRIQAALLPVIDSSIAYLKKKPEVFSRRKLRKEFSDPRFQELAAGIKIFCDPSTGNFNVDPEIAVEIAKIFNEFNPGKTTVLHAEGKNVANTLEDWPHDIPVDIAHVSSKEEMEAAIIAKENGKDVHIEATMHHMALNESAADEIGPYAYMKPPLKSESDRNYLWDNEQYIDRFGSDCAPHRDIDKVGIDGKGRPDPAFGVTNHGEFLPYFINAVMEGKLTEHELYDKISTKPRERFHLPRFEVVTKFILKEVFTEETAAKAEYGCNPFVKLSEAPKMRGRLVMVSTKASKILLSHNSELTQNAEPKYGNLVTF